VRSGPRAAHVHLRRSAGVLPPTGWRRGGFWHPDGGPATGVRVVQAEAPDPAHRAYTPVAGPERSGQPAPGLDSLWTLKTPINTALDTLDTPLPPL
jgi:hypothetical protein